MRPTHQAETQGNAPAVIFRPAFQVTGAMLSATIYDLLKRKPDAKINEDVVKEHVSFILQQHGLEFFDPAETKLRYVKLIQIADAHALELFPDFFPELTEEVKTTLREALAAVKGYIFDEALDSFMPTKKAGKGPKNEKAAGDPGDADPEANGGDDAGDQDAGDDGAGETNTDFPKMKLSKDETAKRNAADEKGEKYELPAENGGKKKTEKKKAEAPAGKRKPGRPPRDING